MAKGTYQVEITETTVHTYIIKDANSPEEAEGEAVGSHEDGLHEGTRVVADRWVEVFKKEEETEDTQYA